MNRIIIKELMSHIPGNQEPYEYYDHSWGWSIPIHIMKLDSLIRDMIRNNVIVDLRISV